jgi:hypothetical protein
MMTSRIIIIMTFCVLCLAGATVVTSDATTTFTVSTIIGIDNAQRTITFKTHEGQTWTLQVADPNILKKEAVAKGDQVTIEIDLNDRITKIIKLSEPSQSEPPRVKQDQFQDDLKP